VWILNKAAFRHCPMKFKITPLCIFYSF